jgi:hypothetical protein
MGVGYASWTQGFEATTTVDTGELRVNLMTDWKGVDNDRLPDEWFSIVGPTTKQPVRDQFVALAATFGTESGSLVAARLYDYKWKLEDNELKTVYTKRLPKDEVYMTQEMTLIDEDTLHVELFDLYPGTMIAKNIYFRNDGTVPVRLSTIPDMETNIATAISKNKRVQALLDAEKLVVEIKYRGLNENMATGTGSSNELIQPGDVFRVLIKVQLDGSVEEVFTTENGDLDVENSGFDFQFKFNFNQATENDA